nr:MAG TPA: TRAP dicarboxylate transporter-DctP subunit periplasmic solute binding family [Caudoviricetes sp.]
MTIDNPVAMCYTCIIKKKEVNQNEEHFQNHHHGHCHHSLRVFLRFIQRPRNCGSLRGSTPILRSFGH